MRMKNPWRKWGIHFDLAGKEKRIEELERKIEEPGFWDKTELSQRIMKELRKMQDCVKEVRDLESSYEDINALIELTEEEMKKLLSL